MVKMNQYTTIYLVRHAKPVSGSYDNPIRPLSNDGMRCAKKLAKVLMSLDCAAVFSSPFKRAIMTIEPYCAESGNNCIIEESLRENREDETREEIAGKILAFLSKHIAKYAGKSIVLCTHGGVIFSLISYFNPSFTYDDYCKISNPDIRRILYNGADGVYDSNFKFDVHNMSIAENN